ncbi:MAG: GTPase [Butyricimonas faecalis]
MGKDNKLHIILLGRRNSGKSSLINALTVKNIAIVSDVAGTTTILVKEVMKSRILHRYLY